jgi:hypothetical protein
MYMYIGPMFHKYNAILRNFPLPVVVACKGNKYTTSINVIVSGLRKLMWVSPIRKVFRGLGNMRLPSSLLVPDDFGVRGGAEPGMMSCTTDFNTALQYLKGKLQPTGWCLLVHLSIYLLTTFLCTCNSVLSIYVSLYASLYLPTYACM